MAKGKKTKKATKKPKPEMLGSGGAYKAAKAIRKRKKRLRDI